MNEDIFQGKWKQLKGDVKKFFGRLTDDDLMEIEGHTDKFMGLLQERYGYTQEQAWKEWDRFWRQYGEGSVTPTSGTARDR